MKIPTQINKNKRYLNKIVKRSTEEYKAIREWGAGMKSRKLTDIKDYRGKINTEKWYHDKYE